MRFCQCAFWQPRTRYPLHRLGRELTAEDCAATASCNPATPAQRGSRSALWLGAEQRWTFSHKATSIHAAVSGLGFAWFAEDTIRHELEQGLLKPLPLREGAEQWRRST